MSDFLAKPIDRDALSNVLKRWLPTDRRSRQRAYRPTGTPPAAPVGDSASTGITTATAVSVSVTAEAAGQLPVLAGFDGGAALRRLRGRADRLARLLRAFAAEHASAHEEIETLLSLGEREGAKGMLHAIKGSARMLGLNAVADEARHVEEALTADRLGRPDMAPLGHRIAELALALAATRPAGSAAPVAGQVHALVAAVDLLALADVVALLYPLLKSREPVPDELLDRLDLLVAAGMPLAELEPLRQCLLGLDNVGALALIEDILARDPIQPEQA